MTQSWPFDHLYHQKPSKLIHLLIRVSGVNVFVLFLLSPSPVTKKVHATWKDLIAISLGSPTHLSH